MTVRCAWLAIFYVALVALPAWAQYWSYDNGPLNGTTDAWTINNGYRVSDTFIAPNNGPPYVFGFAFYAWEYPGFYVGPCALSIVCGSNGGPILSVQWSITSSENGGTTFGNGTASGSNLTDKIVSSNQYGYNIDLITVTGLNVYTPPTGTTYWLNLFNSATRSAEPVYWDENSGVGCSGLNGTGQGCPSMASESALGTIPSESFTINGGFGCGQNCSVGSAGSTPDPSSLVLFATGVVGVAGVLRHKLFL